ncbi:MAG: tetratricopeptide repeat protein, partial [Bacteroidales bacterium]|nr:tetratricopeptide repeat protein [Bacteroidales bacterium]
RMKKIFIILTLIFFSTILFAQSRIDSLENELSRFSGTDIEKIELLKNLSDIYKKRSPQRCIELGNEILKISQNLDYSDWEATAIEIIGTANYNLSNYNEALNSHEKSLKIRKQISDKKGIAKSLNNIGRVYWGLSDFDKALDYYKKALEIREEIDDKKGIAGSLNNIGIIYRELSDFDKALDYYHKSLKIKEKIGNMGGVANSLNNIGSIYWYLSNYDKALEYYLRAIDLREKLDDKIGIAGSLNNIGLIYKQSGKNEKALECYERSLKIGEEIGDKKQIAISLISIGNIYKQTQNYEKAKKYYMRSLQISLEIGDKKCLAICLANIANIYENLNNYDDALKYYMQALDIYKEAADNWGIALSLNSVGYTYFLLKDFNKALMSYEQALQLAEKIKSIEITKELNNNLSGLFFAKRDYKKALEYYKKYSQLKDSIYNKETDKEIAELQLTYETGKKEKENEILRQNNEIQKLSISKQKITQTYLIIIFLLIVVFIFIVALILYNRYRIKIKNNQLLYEQNEQIEIANKKLQQLNNELEKRVDERTSDLKTALINAKKANELKNAFLANMSHEIRTPLNAILGFSEILKKNLNIQKSKELYEYSVGIQYSATRLLNMLNNIIDISRIEANDLKLTLTSCSVNEILNISTEHFKPKANKKELEFIVQISDIPFVKADNKRLINIINHLIDNAVKYTENGFVKITTGFESDKNRVYLKIKDSGIGIEHSFLPHIFEVFRQESSGYTRLYQGAGLGMPLAKKMIELMNGGIEIESVKNKGTTVTIFLPAENTKTMLHQPVINTDKTFIPKKRKGENPNILIVEDDEMNGFVLNKMLEGHGELTLAIDGKETLKIIKKNHKQGKLFEIMLIDINLPSPWDGVKLMNEIKLKWNEYEKIPFIAQTAYAMTNDRIRLIEAGFDDYISKPINKNELYR